MTKNQIKGISYLFGDDLAGRSKDWYAFFGNYKVARFWKFEPWGVYLDCKTKKIFAKNGRICQIEIFLSPKLPENKYFLHFLQRFSAFCRLHITPWFPTFWCSVGLHPLLVGSLSCLSHSRVGRA